MHLRVFDFLAPVRLRISTDWFSFYCVQREEQKPFDQKGSSRAGI